MRSFTALAFFILLSVVAVSVSGAESKSSLCESFDDDSIALEEKNFEVIEEAIPLVPPDEASYLKQEQETVFKAIQAAQRRNESTHELNRRYNALTNRRFYYAWGVRNDLKELREQFRKIVSDKGTYFPMQSYRNPEANKLHRAASTLFNAYSTGISMNSFVNNEMNRADRVVAPDTLIGGQFRLQYMASTLAFYIQCKLSRVAQPNR